MTLKEAVFAYDAALSACANDPEKMSSFCSAEGQDLDDLYEAMLEAAAQAPQPKGSAPTKQFEDWGSAHGNAATDNVEELCGRAWEAALSASQLSVQAAGPSVDPIPGKAQHDAFEWLRSVALAEGAPPEAGIALDEWHRLATIYRTERPLLQSEAADVEPTEEQLLALATDGGGASFLLPMQKQAALNRGREAWERFKAAAPLASRAPALLCGYAQELGLPLHACTDCSYDPDEIAARRPRAPAQALGGEREAFEESARTFFDPDRASEIVARDEGGNYVEWGVMLAWEVWQARAALAHRATAQAPEQPVHLTEPSVERPEAVDDEPRKPLASESPIPATSDTPFWVDFRTWAADRGYSVPEMAKAWQGYKAGREHGAQA